MAKLFFSGLFKIKMSDFRNADTFWLRILSNFASETSIFCLPVRRQESQEILSDIKRKPNN